MIFNIDCLWQWCCSITPPKPNKSQRNQFPKKVPKMKWNEAKWNGASMRANNKKKDWITFTRRNLFGNLHFNCSVPLVTWGYCKRTFKICHIWLTLVKKTKEKKTKSKSTLIIIFNICHRCSASKNSQNKTKNKIVLSFCHLLNKYARVHFEESFKRTESFFLSLDNFTIAFELVSKSLFHQK